MTDNVCFECGGELSKVADFHYWCGECDITWQPECPREHTDDDLLSPEEVLERTPTPEEFDDALEG